ncbi:MAG: hypothetical protein AB7L90_21995 [Hyphomicrobiaceae bacterium]
MAKTADDGPMRHYEKSKAAAREAGVDGDLRRSSGALNALAKASSKKAKKAAMKSKR